MPRSYDGIYKPATHCGYLHSFQALAQYAQTGTWGWVTSAQTADSGDSRAQSGINPDVLCSAVGQAVVCDRPVKNDLGFTFGTRSLDMRYRVLAYFFATWDHFRMISSSDVQNQVAVLFLRQPIFLTQIFEVEDQHMAFSQVHPLAFPAKAGKRWAIASSNWTLAAATGVQCLVNHRALDTASFWTLYFGQCTVAMFSQAIPVEF
ncbi:hypothetical protein DFH06DRAFT_1427343 [Mycena polygramma]|nr:hypothetical protein DFH06DRAFT_1427343 [Mycena polygramma]